ncbi:hypothetical protein ACLOJK_006308 [Asimina triloba]
MAWEEEEEEEEVLDKIREESLWNYEAQQEKWRIKHLRVEKVTTLSFIAARKVEAMEVEDSPQNAT